MNRKSKFKFKECKCGGTAEQWTKKTIIGWEDFWWCRSCNKEQSEIDKFVGNRGESKKPGRPPGSTSTRPTREVIKQIRWTEKEWESIEAAAKAKGQTVAKYQRERILR